MPTRSPSNPDTNAAKKDAAYWIRQLQLTSHVEGGYYKEVYRSQATTQTSQAAGGSQGTRSLATSIYFLLTMDQFSAFHRIYADELWHFYAGQTVLIYEIHPTGELLVHRLGPDPERGESLVVLIRAGHWFASRVDHGGSYGLVGCTVTPGFEFFDFQLGSRKELTALYPLHEALIASLTR
jgi:predicted cupin superfamily sugar epimerase